MEHQKAFACPGLRFRKRSHATPQCECHGDAAACFVYDETVLTPDRRALPQGAIEKFGHGGWVGAGVFAVGSSPRGGGGAAGP